MNPAGRASRPRSVYAFVVVALAAFLALFVLWRSPGITYRVQAELVAPGRAEAETPDAPAKRMAPALEELREPTFIVAALRAADQIRGETSPEMEQIAAHIGRQVQVRLRETEQGELRIQLALETQIPRAAVQLLDSMTTQSKAVTEQGMLALPATVVDQRGGSVTPAQLVLLTMIASVCGFAAVGLAERSGPTPVLYTERDVEEAVGMPVLANLADGEVARLRNPAYSRRRAFRVLLSAAEVGIAALFLLMLLQVATQDAFPSRFCADPLAACGEALTRVIG